MFFGYWGSSQADGNDHEAGDSQENESKVEVVDISQDGGTKIWLTAGRSCVGELQNHTD